MPCHRSPKLWPKPWSTPCQRRSSNSLKRSAPKSRLNLRSPFSRIISPMTRTDASIGRWTAMIAIVSKIALNAEVTAEKRRITRV